MRVLPESAGILFGGGFPRGTSADWCQSAQRAIFYVQRELEVLGDSDNAAVVLCDRGTIDGAAYWQGDSDLFSSVGTTLSEQLARYDAVIHLRTPGADSGYNHQNPLRTETPAAAAEIDERLVRLWETHPRRFVIPPSEQFLEKAERTLKILRGMMPECCHSS